MVTVTKPSNSSGSSRVDVGNCVLTLHSLFSPEFNLFPIFIPNYQPWNTHFNYLSLLLFDLAVLCDETNQDPKRKKRDLTWRWECIAEWIIREEARVKRKREKRTGKEEKEEEEGDGKLSGFSLIADQWKIRLQLTKPVT